MRLRQSEICRRQRPQKCIRGGSYSRRPFPSLPNPLPFSLSPTPFDACYAGYCESCSATSSKGMRILESWKFLLVESRILVFGIQNTAQGIQNPTKVIIWNLSSTQDWNTVPGIRNPGRGIQDPRLSRIALHDSNIDYCIVSHGSRASLSISPLRRSGLHTDPLELS